VLPLQLLSLVLPQSLGQWLPWLIASAILVLGLVVYGWRDLLRLRTRRIWAISDVCFTEAIRRRVLWVTPLAIIGVIVVAQLSRPADAQDAIRQATKFCLFASGLLVAITAVILACTNLPREIENRVIYTIVTKPTTRLEIVVGKVLGFARVSGSIILIMGIFTYGYLKVRSWAEMAQVRSELASLPAQSTVRPSLEHYVQTGFLSTLSLDEPQKLEILGRPPQGEKLKWMQGGQGEYAAIPFYLTDDDRATLQEAAERGSVFLTTTLRVEQHTPDEEEQKLLKQMGLERPAVDMTKVSPVLGPELPSTEPTTEPAATAIPTPQLRISLSDENGRPIFGDIDTASGMTVEVKAPDHPQDLWRASMLLSQEAVRRLAGVSKIYVRIQAHTPATDYGLTENPISLTIPTTGQAIIISSAPDKNGALPTPDFFSFPARRGMRLISREGGTGALAVYHFAHADVGHPVGGKVPLQLRFALERAGDFDTTGSAYARVSVQAVNRDSGKSSPQIEFAPEQSQTRFLDIPADAMAGGNFDVLVRGLTPNMLLGVSTDSVSVVVSNQSFLLNLFKSLLLLWLLSLLVIIISVFCSTFLSWPIAVICTLMLLLGHWGVEQLGDALKPGASRAFAQDFQIQDPAVTEALTKAMDNLSGMLQTISRFLPDVSQFPITDYIEKGVSIPMARIGGALGVLFCYGLPLVVLSYVIMRNKEVAP
jgi:ABC-type transport system involved in multi-copper enzyme maturation permease subunit